MSKEEIINFIKGICVEIKIFDENSDFFKASSKDFMEYNLREELNVDSLDIYELVFRIEKHFSISIADESVGDIETVADLVNKIIRLQGK